MKYINILGEDNYFRVKALNRFLVDRFLDYQEKAGRSARTVAEYRRALKTFFIWNADENGNVLFTGITEDGFVRFRKKAMDEWGWGTSYMYFSESVLSSLSSYVEEHLQDDARYAGYRNIIRKVRISPGRDQAAGPVYDEGQLMDLLEMLLDSDRHKEACILALAMYSGATARETLRLEASSFSRNALCADGLLYRVPLDGRNLYVIKEKFDPYLEGWLAYRKDEGIVSRWLFPGTSDASRPLPFDSLHSVLKNAARVSDMSMYWESLRRYAAVEFGKADLPYGILREMAGIDKNDMIAMYIGNRKEKRDGQ